jgi:hypothetical protein
LSFPPHLVRDYLEKFNADGKSVVLDPFCGTGTTNVECKKQGIKSVGVEANPMAYFSSRIKVDWSPRPEKLLSHAKTVGERVIEILDKEGIIDEDLSERPSANLKALPKEQMKLLLKNSISPLPLHKTLTLLEVLSKEEKLKVVEHEKLALAKALVDSIGNLHFGPEVGVRNIKEDASVVNAWLAQVTSIASDLETLRRFKDTKTVIFDDDSREFNNQIKPGIIDMVITSPPYPNEKDYTRTTRLESVLLGFLQEKKQLRAMKERFIRSNTRNVFVSDRDDKWIKGNKKIIEIADSIENRRIELGKNSGFERLYSRVAKLYFGGLKRHLEALRVLLKPGARLAYVVGDQASYLRVMIRTGELLAEIAESLGYKVEGIDLFRTRFATATGEQLKEEVVLLRWPGNQK